MEEIEVVSCLVESKFWSRDEFEYVVEAFIPRNTNCLRMEVNRPNALEEFERLNEAYILGVMRTDLFKGAKCSLTFISLSSSESQNKIKSRLCSDIIISKHFPTI
jgi:hypothetical protein